MAAKIFFSYSHKDESLRDELAAHLRLMERQGVISGWHDRRIGAGAALDSAIARQLEEADIVLALASADFFNSDYCYDREMQRALERSREGKCIVIPIILRECDWKHSPLAALRVTPLDGRPVTSFSNRDEAFRQVADDIRAAAQGFRVSGGRSGPDRGHVNPRESDPVAEVRPKSRFRRSFSDADRDGFLGDAFQRMASYIETQVTALPLHAQHLDGRFERIDSRAFTVSIYEGGRRAASGSVWHDGRAIYYSSQPHAHRGGYNESFSIGDDGCELQLKPMGISMLRGEKGAMTPDEAATYVWDLITTSLRA